MSTVARIGLDLTKTLFELHGVDAQGMVVVRVRLRQGRVLDYFAGLPPCLVGMESCGAAHRWARDLRRLGHDARLMSPQSVAPYRSRLDAGATQAQALCEAAGELPTLRQFALLGRLLGLLR